MPALTFQEEPSTSWAVVVGGRLIARGAICAPAELLADVHGPAFRSWVDWSEQEALRLGELLTGGGKFVEVPESPLIEE